MKCPYCNEEIANDVVFCTNCGHKLSSKSPNKKALFAGAAVIALLVLNLLAWRIFTNNNGKTEIVTRTDTIHVVAEQAEQTGNQETQMLDETVNMEDTEEMPDPVLTNLVQNMVEVHRGTFMMGASSSERGVANKDEYPSHEVTVETFKIGRYEVTQQEWIAVMGSNPSVHIGPQLPVNNISWNDCMEFIQRLNQKTSKHFRLPTEAEWEFAARGGNSSSQSDDRYSGSNIIDDVGWSNTSAPHNVGLKAPNRLGLYDMSGNVYEWVSNYYGGEYSSSAQTNPRGPSSGEYRIRRGGSFKVDPKFCRVAFRGTAKPDSRREDVGLRLAQ